MATAFSFDRRFVLLSARSAWLIYFSLYLGLICTLRLIHEVRVQGKGRSASSYVQPKRKMEKHLLGSECRGRQSSGKGQITL